jgi:polar amino acid transport system substrate-binding protein
MLKFTLILLFFSASLFSEAKQLKLVACIDDHPPYQYLGENPYGTHISALKTLAKVLEKKIVLIQSPNFARCVAFLRTGYVDVVAGLNQTEERKEYAFFAPFKLADKLTVITRKDLTIDKYNDFTGKIIGIPRGATYFTKFDNDETLNKISIQNERVGLALLVKNRIDLMIANHDVLDLHFEDITKSELKASPINLDEHRTKYTYFGFSEKNNLDLSKEEITSTIKKAFEKGRFILP